MKLQMGTKAVSLVEKFWGLMKTNDFRSVGSVLADDFVLDWPQSHERISGRDNYAGMNEEYPANGPWEFTVHRIVGNDVEAVSHASVPDGVQKARAISFFEIRDGKIAKMVEFWPEPSTPLENRKHLVEDRLIREGIESFRLREAVFPQLICKAARLAGRDSANHCSSRELVDQDRPIIIINNMKIVRCHIVVMMMRLRNTRFW